MLSLRCSSAVFIRRIESFIVALAASAALTGLVFAQQPPQRPAAKLTTVATKSAAVTPPAAAGPQKLPLRRVVLYKSGIGYFEHDGRVHGNEKVEIDLTSSQLNDVLKSLTALDFGGGRISGASYNSQEPAGHQLDTLPVPVGQSSTLPDLLRQLRGARVEVRTANASFTGRLVSVNQEVHTSAGGDEWKADGISVMDDTGNVRSFSLETATSVRFADRVLEMQLERALGLLDSAHQEDVRHLVLSTAGQAERSIRVSYISEVPIWKTTYRIVLPGPESPAGTKPLLQGWAVVDNTVGEDWNDVELSLAAGAPQSFIQQLSQPYYLQRPVVGLPRGVLLSPQTHAETLSSGAHVLQGNILDPDGRAIVGANVRATNTSTNESEQTFSDETGAYSFDALAPGDYTLAISMPNFKTLAYNSVHVLPGRTTELNGKLEIGASSVSIQVEAGGQQIVEAQSTSVSNTASGKSALAGRGGRGGASTSGGPRNSTFEGLPKGTLNTTFDGINIQDQLLNSADGFFALNDPQAYLALQSSVTGAEGSLLGDVFEYKLRDHVTIHKNESALVPIVQAEIAAEKVSLWNANLGTPRPLRALWLTNSSTFVLDGGSFNVLDDGAFAGEGLIETVHPGEKRLISYAADLAMQVVPKSEPAPQVLTRVRVARGVMYRTVQSKSTTSYKIRNEDTSARVVIIEQPIRSGWKLSADLKPEEQTATTYRFRVEVAPKETKDFAVTETSPTSSQIQINNVNSSQLETFVTRHEITPELEKALRDILAQKDSIAKLDADMRQRQDELESIGQDQDRVRQDLQSLKGTPEEKALAQRYVAELNDQETRLGVLKKEIADLQEKIKLAQEDLDATIEHLSFDDKMNQ